MSKTFENGLAFIVVAIISMFLFMDSDSSEHIMRICYIIMFIGAAIGYGYQIYRIIKERNDPIQKDT
jgi:hypothetical protein